MKLRKKAIDEVIDWLEKTIQNDHGLYMNENEKIVYDMIHLIQDTLINQTQNTDNNVIHDIHVILLHDDAFG